MILLVRKYRSSARTSAAADRTHHLCLSRVVVSNVLHAVTSPLLHVCQLILPPYPMASTTLQRNPKDGLRQSIMLGHMATPDHLAPHQSCEKEI